MNFYKLTSIIFLFFFSLFFVGKTEAQSININNNSLGKQNDTISKPYKNPFNDVYSMIYYLEYGAFGTRKIFDGETLSGKVKEIEISYTQYAIPELKGKRVIRVFDENGFLKEYNDGELKVKMVTVENHDSTKTIMDEYSLSGNQIKGFRKRCELKYHRQFDKKGNLISLNNSCFINSLISGNINYEFDEKTKTTKAIASTNHYLKWGYNGYLMLFRNGDYVTELKYNSNGKILKTNHYNINNTGKYLKDFKYDIKGDILKITETSWGQIKTNSYQNEWIDNSKMVYQKEYFNSPFTTYSYDEKYRVNIVYSYGPDEKGEMTMYNAIRIKYY